MGILQELLPTMYEIRGFLDTEVGARPYTITAVNEIKPVANKWDGSNPITTTTTPIVEANSGSPKVRTLSHDDYLRGAPADADLVVGPITPGYIDYSTFEPSQGKLYFRVNGPDMVNVKYLKAGFVAESALSWYLYLKRAGTDAI
jgi:hypothetical protein